jgi:hypothetical protein
MFARNVGPRSMVTLGSACCALAALIAGVVSGCNGSNAATAMGPDASVDGPLMYEAVMTGGGGVPAADASQGNPFGSSSSSSSSSGGDSGMDGGSSSGGDDAGLAYETGCADDAAMAPGDDGPYMPPICNGTATCDLRTHTCCLANSASGLVGTCVDGTCMDCPSNEATVHCLQSAECPTGLSCCGDIITILGQVKSSCVNVPQGGSCPYVPATLAQVGVQLCKTDAECMNGQPCVHQTCIYGAILDMCGLQSGAPLNCTQ